MTEMSPVSHLAPPGRGPPGRGGLAVPGTECRIVDPLTGATCRAGRGGRALGARAAGDEGLPQQPAGDGEPASTDGWLSTGDIAMVDADGYLFIRTG
jgi:long-subunit acyl-CoA synthetase (AMP-forming)